MSIPHNSAHFSSKIVDSIWFYWLGKLPLARISLNRAILHLQNTQTPFSAHSCRKSQTFPLLKLTADLLNTTAAAHLKYSLSIKRKTSALKISIVCWRTLHPRGAQNADSWKFLLPFAQTSSLSRNTGLFSCSLYRDSAENTHTQVYLPSDISSKMFSLSGCSRGVINLRSIFKRLQTLRSWTERIYKHTLMSDGTFDPEGYTLLGQLNWHTLCYLTSQLQFVIRVSVIKIILQMYPPLWKINTL